MRCSFDERAERIVSSHSNLRREGAQARGPQLHPRRNALSREPLGLGVVLDGELLDEAEHLGREGEREGGRAPLHPRRARGLSLSLSPTRDEKPRVRERARASAHRDDAADAGRELAQAREEHARGREAPRVDVGREHVEPHAQAQLA